MVLDDDEVRHARELGVIHASRAYATLIQQGVSRSVAEHLLRDLAREVVRQNTPAPPLTFRSYYPKGDV